LSGAAQDRDGEVPMSGRRWLVIIVLIAIGAIVASVEGNRYTSTDAFCTSCHSMTLVAADPHFRQSAHRSNSAGVHASCGDCHIPKTNWFIETYAHAASGIKDTIAEYTNDFSKPAAWETRRIELAHEVRDKMRRQDSVTCRSCHDAVSIHPSSERGRAAHALQRERNLTCINCHFNLVHAPVPPRLEFLRGSNLGGTK
jgi:nitrate/TMAO reductase-like tetraheme cytochrome c subunit